MMEFFRGRRRKIGCVTLLIALVAIGGWVRSFAYMDLLEFYSGTNTTTSLVSMCGSVVWETAHDKDVHDSLSIPEWTSAFPSPSISNFYHGDDWHDWRSCGFGISKVVYKESDRRAYLTTSRICCWVPYWFITIPLTLISAYQLLTKSRNSNQKKSSELIANEGAAS